MNRQVFIIKVATTLLPVLVLGCANQSKKNDSKQPPVVSGHESNGGTELAANFIKWGQVIHDTLVKSSGNPPLLSSEKLAALNNAVGSTNVEVIGGGDPFLDNKGAKVHARVVPDSLRPGHLKIQLEEKYWQEASPANFAVCRLVFHEYLRVIGEDKVAPEDVYALSNRWNTSCGLTIVAQALANLDFEMAPQENSWPESWSAGSPDKNYLFSSDSAQVHGGKQSMRIDAPKATSSTNYGWAGQCIEAGTYKGKVMVLSGFLKTKEVDEGYAGLWVRADDAEGQMLDMDNMDGRGLSGTADWTKVEVTLSIPLAAAQICMGALLTGKGSAWFDDLNVVERR